MICLWARHDYRNLYAVFICCLLFLFGICESHPMRRPDVHLCAYARLSRENGLIWKLPATATQWAHRSRDGVGCES